MVYPRQGYWRWLPFPSPGNLPDPGIKLKFPALAGRFFTTEPSGTFLQTFKILHLLTSWKRKWQPTPVFLPGESQGRGSLVGCHLWGRTESDTTEAT